MPSCGNIVATETENPNDMNVENNHTAETEAEATSNGSETITIQSTLGDEGGFIYTLRRLRNFNLTMCLGLAHFVLMQYC